MITVEDFLYMEDKHKLLDYPDQESVDKVYFKVTFYHVITHLMSVISNIFIMEVR